MTEGRLTSKQEQLLADVVAGARTVDDPEVVAERQDRRFAVELDSLLRTRHQLGGAADLLKRDLAESAGEPEPFSGADELIRSAVAGQLRSGHRRRVVIGIAIAAGILASLSTWWWWPEDGVPRDQWLKGNIACDAPTGKVQAFGEFSWRFELPPDGYFVVEVFDQRDLATAVTRSTRLETPHWRPTAEIPRAIRWRVTAFDEFGNSLESGWTEAER